ncbi:MAG: hypothetical protein MUP92_02420, partial [Actinobacteria bacterium]|nr:hypothetical protein [Actinomycetota bacterium]
MTTTAEPSVGAGRSVPAASYGLPDLGMTSLNDVLEDVRRITSVTELPLLADAAAGSVTGPRQRTSV